MSDTSQTTHIEAIVAAEVHKQLDRERVVLKEAAGLALKIVAGAFLLLVAIFTIFGLTTWRDVAKETTNYMKGKVDELVQKTDTETGVKQTLNDLVNRAIVAAELTSLKRETKKDFLLPKWEWDRLRAWMKVENLDLQDFSDALAVLAAQAENRRKADANAFLSEMLSPPEQSPYRWIRKQQDKQLAILATFKHVDMGASALEMVQATTLSVKMRSEAVEYLGEINYADCFDKLMALASTVEDGELKTELLVTSATLRPMHPTFGAAVGKLTSQTSTNALISSTLIVRRMSSRGSFADGDDGNVVNELAKQLLLFIFRNDGYVALQVDDYPRTGETWAQRERILIWVPTDRAGGRSRGHSFERVEFEKFRPYWELLAAAANDSDETAVRQRMPRLRTFSSRDGKLVSMIRLGFGENSALTVQADDEAEKRIIRKADATEVYLLPSSHSPFSRATDILKVRLVDRNKRAVDGKVIDFAGGGFIFSLSRAE